MGVLIDHVGVFIGRTVADDAIIHSFVVLGGDSEVVAEIHTQREHWSGM